MRLITTLLVLPLCVGCVSDGAGTRAGAPRLEHSYGSVVTGDLDTVWSAVSATFKDIDIMAARITDATHTASVPYMGAKVTVKAERKDAQSTILRIQAVRDGEEAIDISDKVMTAIQRRLF
jgi:hypothetical protein